MHINLLLRPEVKAVYGAYAGFKWLVPARTLPPLPLPRTHPHQAARLELFQLSIEIVFIFIAPTRVGPLLIGSRNEAGREGRRELRG